MPKAVKLKTEPQMRPLFGGGYETGSRLLVTGFGDDYWLLDLRRLVDYWILGWSLGGLFLHWNAAAGLFVNYCVVDDARFETNLVAVGERHTSHSTIDGEKAHGNFHLPGSSLCWEFAA